VFEPFVDGFHEAIGAAGLVKVGQDIAGMTSQRPSESDDFTGEPLHTKRTALASESGPDTRAVFFAPENQAPAGYFLRLCARSKSKSKRRSPHGKTKHGNNTFRLLTKDASKRFPHALGAATSVNIEQIILSQSLKTVHHFRVAFHVL